MVKLSSWTRKKPRLTPNFSMGRSLGGEQDDERDRQRMDGRGFRESQAEDHVRLDGGSGVRVAAHGLHGAARDDTDADTAAEHAHSGQARAPVLAALAENR